MTETKTLAAALAMVQTKLPVVTKGSTAKVKTKSGADYSYSFANLADIAPVVYPLLGEVGLAFVCAPTLRGNSYVLVGRLEHTSGQCRSGIFPLPRDTDPQTLGSALTYGRRYLLGCLTGVVTGDEDDDGAQATRTARGAQARAGAAARAETALAAPPAPRAGASRAPAAAPAAARVAAPGADRERTVISASIVRLGQKLGIGVPAIVAKYKTLHDAELSAATVPQLAVFEGELQAELDNKPAE